MDVFSYNARVRFRLKYNKLTSEKNIGKSFIRKHILAKMRMSDWFSENSSSANGMTFRFITILQFSRGIPLGPSISINRAKYLVTMIKGGDTYINLRSRFNSLMYGGDNNRVTLLTLTPFLHFAADLLDL
jgi:hypothetical protein